MGRIIVSSGARRHSAGIVLLRVTSSVTVALQTTAIMHCIPTSAAILRKLARKNANDI